MEHIKNTLVEVINFYPEEFRRKADAEKYKAKGTCEVFLELDGIEIEIKNITYRIDHDNKIALKPPFRMHSNKKAGIKPKLVPSIVFRDPIVWQLVEQKIKEEIPRMKIALNSIQPMQLDLFEV